MESEVVPAPGVWDGELEVGSTHHLSECTVGEDEIIRFAAQWDPHWFHTDPEAAEEGSYGGLTASGVQRMPSSRDFPLWPLLGIGMSSPGEGFGMCNTVGLCDREPRLPDACA